MKGAFAVYDNPVVVASYPDVGGHYVVWEDDRAGGFDIYAYDLATRSGFSVCTAPGMQDAARTDGSTVVTKQAARASRGPSTRSMRASG